MKFTRGLPPKPATCNDHPAYQAAVLSPSARNHEACVCSNEETMHMVIQLFLIPIIVYCYIGSKSINKGSALLS